MSDEMPWDAPNASRHRDEAEWANRAANAEAALGESKAEVAVLRRDLEEAREALTELADPKNLRPAAGDNSWDEWMNASLRASFIARAVLARLDAKAE